MPAVRCAPLPRHRVEILGQIPAMFNLEWMLKDYDRYDLSSLKFAAYGGHAVSRPFVDQLATMAPVIGTGLGLTEAPVSAPIFRRVRPTGRRFSPDLARTCRSIRAPFANPCAPTATPAMNCRPARLAMCAFAGHRPFLAMSTILPPPPRRFRATVSLYR